MPLPIIVWAAGCLLAVWAGYSYNLLVHARTKVRDGMSDVDAQLKSRHDLVPNLNELVRGYADRGNDAMRAAAAQRSRAIAALRTTDVEAAENKLAAEISRVLEVAEDFPQLKGSARLLALSDHLRAIEDEIQGASSLYNANVEFYNTRAQRLPTSLVAMWMKPKTFPFLEFETVRFNAGLTRVGEFAA
jgi:LemA protein